MEITAAMVKELRDRTGAGMMQCKKALADAEGDVEKAGEAIRKMGMASVAKRADRTVAEGRVEAYIHPGNRLGALVEVNCETDFVARTDDFIHLCREVAMQIAATSPSYVRREEIPAEILEEEKHKARERLADGNLSGDDLEAAIGREIDTFVKEQVLLEQPNIRDTNRTIGQLVTDCSAKLGENMKVARFSYFRLGVNP